jgi:hypothetical protein
MLQILSWIMDGMCDESTEVTEDANCFRDNEKPQRKANVHAFQAKGRPITNEEVHDTATKPVRIILTSPVRPLHVRPANIHCPSIMGR